MVRRENPMIEELTRAQYDAALRNDFALFAARCFHQLNPQAELAMNWHLEVIAAKLTAVREGKIRRLIICLPPRHLKSLMASIAFPAWLLGHNPSAQILCVSYAQDRADKLARDCRGIMIVPWYQRIFPTLLSAHRQAVQEFITTRQGYRLATSTGGVLIAHGGINRLQRFCAFCDPEECETGLHTAPFWTPDNTSLLRDPGRGATDTSGANDMRSVAGSESGCRLNFEQPAGLLAHSRDIKSVAVISHRPTLFFGVRYARSGFCSRQ